MSKRKKLMRKKIEQARVKGHPATVVIPSNMKRASLMKLFSSPKIGG